VRESSQSINHFDSPIVVTHVNNEKIWQAARTGQQSWPPLKRQKYRRTWTNLISSNATQYGYDKTKISDHITAINSCNFHGMSLSLGCSACEISVLRTTTSTRPTQAGTAPLQVAKPPAIGAEPTRSGLAAPPANVPGITVELCSRLQIARSRHRQRTVLTITIGNHNAVPSKCASFQCHTRP